MTTAKQEALAIAELAWDMTAENPDRAVHCCVSGGAVNVTVFTPDNDIAWQENLYDWSHDEAFLPKLRLIRHRLEELHKEALAERQELVA